MTIAVMQRYEMKYLLTPQQTAYLREQLKGHMDIDEYGLTTIASIYYDTPNCRLIRSSIDGSDYKEKIRLRSYGVATSDSPVYLELKRKANGIVYKRRVETTIPSAEDFFSADGTVPDSSQIASEILFFRDYYHDLSPTCVIIYDRTAYYQPDGDLRLTIDENPRYRTNDLSLTGSMEGTSLLKPGWTILEVKIQDSMPLWLSEILSKGRIYKGSFSKYGEVFRLQAASLINRKDVKTHV